MSKRGRQRRINAPMLAAAIATIVCGGSYALHRAGAITIPSLDSWELATLDARFRLRGERQPKDDRIVILGLDDKTRLDAPEVFQSRRGWARLLDRLATYKPELVAIDAFFQSPEINLSPEVVAQVKEARTGLGAEAELEGAPLAAARALDAVIEETAGDAALAAAVERAGNIVIAVMFGLQSEQGGEPESGDYEPAALPAARFKEQALIEAPPSRRPPRAVWTASTMPLIAEHQAGAGYVNVIPDSDGHTRRMPLAIERGGRFYMPLALAVTSMHLGAPTGYLTGATDVSLGDRQLPVNRRGQALISFLGAGNGKTFPHVSAADVISGAAARESLEGKLVFIGYTDAARDTAVTPFNTTLHGVELHATLAHNVLHRELLRQSGPWVAVLTILFFGALITGVQHNKIRRRRAWVASAVGGLLLVGYLITAQMLFAGGLVLDVVAPMGGVVVVILASLVAGLATEGREKAQLRAAFSQYVQDTLVDRILADPNRVRLGGVRRELTVLFSDIRGFSRFSEGLEPEELSEFLNEYLTPMTELVMDSGGMLDKYIGDAIMAVYGAPLEMADHARRACDAALRMQSALTPLNRDWTARGLPEIHIGVGINTGPMSVGNMGSEARFDYTVLGDSVNLGARLEALTKEVGAKILCGERTVEAAGDAYVFREIGRVVVRGRDAPARVFELVAATGESPFSPDDLALYDDALDAVADRRWDEAESAARRFAEAHAGDPAVAKLLERIADLRADPPGDDWDGTLEQRSK